MNRFKYGLHAGNEQPARGLARLLCHVGALVAVSSLLTLPALVAAENRTQEQLNAELMAAVESGKGVAAAMEALATDTLEKARKAGLKAEDIEKLEQLLAHVEKWTRQMEDGGQKRDQQGASLGFPQLIRPESGAVWAPPPAATGEPSGLDNRGAGGDDALMRAFMSVFAAAVCVSQPPACAIVMPMMISMGLGDETTSAVQTMQGIQGAVTNGQVGPELEERLRKQLEDVARKQVGDEFYESIKRLPRELEKLPNDQAALLRILQESIAKTDIANELLAALPTWAQTLLAEIKKGTNPDRLCNLFPQDDRGPYFANEGEKDAVQWAISSVSAQYRKYWTETLSKVRLQGDPDRRRESNPCR